MEALHGSLDDLSICRCEQHSGRPRSHWYEGSSIESTPDGCLEQSTMKICDVEQPAYNLVMMAIIQTLAGQLIELKIIKAYPDNTRPAQKRNRSHEIPS